MEPVEQMEQMEQAGQMKEVKSMYDSNNDGKVRSITSNTSL